MEDWKKNVVEGLQMLGEAIKVGLAQQELEKEDRSEMCPGQIRGLVRLAIALERGRTKRGVLYPGVEVRVFDEIDRTTHSGVVTKLWSPYGYEMAKVRADDTLDEDWYPERNCTVLR